MTEEERTIMEIAARIQHAMSEDPMTRIILVSCPHCQEELNKLLQLENFIQDGEARDYDA